MQQGSNITQPTTADPYWIASYFVSKYYDVLAKNPVYFNRFYKAQSTLTVIDMADDSTPGTTAVGEQDIQQQVNNSIAGAAARHKLVDAQFSMNGGILLSVAGTVLLKGVERNFTQTFFLAPQENGFYVFNDMLRIFPPTSAGGLPASSPVPAAPPAAPAASQATVAAPAPAPSPASTISYAAPEQAQPHAATASPSPPPAAAAPQQQPAAAQQPPQQAAAPSQQQRAPAAPQRAASGAAAAAPQRAASPAAAAPVATPTAASPPTPSTWAEIARLKQKEQQVGSSPAPAAAKEAAAPPAQQPAVAAAAAAAPAEKPVANGTHHAPAAADSTTSTSHPQPALHTILVKNLPPEHLQIEELETKFSKYGALHRRGAGAVTIHNTGREGKVAYIKFADAAGVEAALQATDVIIHDRTVEISRHEGPLPSHGRGGPGGRGGPYRGGSSSSGGRAAGRGGSYGDGAAPRERGERRADGVARGDGSRGAGEGRGSGEGRGARLERRPSSGAAAAGRGGSSGRGSGRNGGGRRDDQAATAASKD